MPGLPTGTVTFLFTDIEGSTTLLQRVGDRRYAEVLAEHQRLLRDAFARGNGQEIDTQGDAFLVAFSRARDALATAVAAQQALMKYPWPDRASLRVRMGLHTGEPIRDTDRYVGLDVHRAARIGAAGHGGQILLSDAVSGLAARDLPPGVSLRDLGTHRLKDLQEPEHLFQVLHSDLAADFPLLKSLDVVPNNLPVQLTSFIGREREKAEVKQLLSTTRFLTVTGSGGAGKTRLALQVAREVLEEFPGGVWLVELAVLSDPSLVPKAVASALDVPEQPGRGLTEALTDSLRGKSVLIILDNCEHLVAACADLTTTLLRACPNLRVLATSREALGVTGETTWRVPSLSVPDPQRLPPLDRFQEYEAVRLFIDRAVANAPQFAVTSGNAPAVAQVCHRLDGIPLAIELAAARVKVLAVEQIARRLDDRFRLLTRGNRTAAPRHRTLRATMDWSYALLSEQERLLLRRLAVFIGGWTFPAAEAVCGTPPLQRPDVMDLLAQLVEKSLVLTEQRDDEARYRMLETVREYAHAGLAESGEAETVSARHRDWYLGLAERAASEMQGPRQGVWLDRLEDELDNLRAAFGWSQNRQDAGGVLLRLATALRRFWFMRGRPAEGRKWLEDALDQDRGAPPDVVIKALDGAAHLARQQRDYPRALVLAEQGLALARAQGDKEGTALSLDNVGLVAALQGDFHTAIDTCERSLTLWRELGDRWQISTMLRELGAWVSLQGDHGRAIAYHTESLELARQLGDNHRMASALRGLGDLALLQGDVRRATTCFSEGLTLSRETGNRLMIRISLDGLAAAACAQGRHKRGACLAAAAEALREALGRHRSAIYQRSFDQYVTTARAALGDPAFVAAWDAGRAMTLEQAIEYALTEN